MRVENQLISQILPVRMSHNSKRGRRPLTFTDVVARDVDMNVYDMVVAMPDRVVWRGHVDNVSMDGID